MPQLIGWVIGASVLCLAALGAMAAKAGGAPKLPATLRVTVLGAAAMAVTAGVGALFGVAV
ncbi:VIT family protein [compost metagenome]